MPQANAFGIFFGGQVPIVLVVPPVLSSLSTHFSISEHVSESQSMESHMQHIESMGDKWFVLGVDSNAVLGVMATTLELGGTRPVWGMKDENVERMLMAWPSDSLLR